MNIREKLQARKAKRLQKKRDRIDYLLSTTNEERKADRKAQKLARSVKRLQKLRSLRPLNLKCVRWYEKRLADKLNHVEVDAKGIVGGDVAPA